MREERTIQRSKINRHMMSTPLSLLSAIEKSNRKKLLNRIEKQVAVVLRRADDAMVPMEIPEARDIALQEILDLEIEEEKELVKVRQI